MSTHKINFCPRSVFVSQFFKSPHSNPPAPPADPAPAPFYCVLMVGVGIFGTGRTRETAISAAKKLFGIEGPLDLPVYVQSMPKGILSIARCTEKMALHIEHSGGAVSSFTVTENGDLDLSIESGALDRFDESFEIMRAKVEADNFRIFGGALI